MNVSNLGTSGNYFSKTSRVMIENSRYQWSHNSATAINLLGVGRAIIDRTECVDEADQIRADAATAFLTVIDSTYGQLYSDAQNTKVVNTESPDEDPVQYVRRQYAAVLEREPDPAAHYYWSSTLLDCGGDADCVSSAQADLAFYLENSPSATFTLQGQVTVDDSALLSGALVTLSGSQSVTTVTDDQGRYTFSNLPTSGDYTVTVAKNHYAFAQSAVEVTTPVTDQIIDFSGLVNRHIITGRISESGGHVFPSAILTLGGSDDAITETDSDGNYSFADVADGGNYTITPSNGAYVFTPESQAIDDLSSDHVANFTLVTHGIAGRVTNDDGTPIISTVVSLSGGANASTTTDANGFYSFSYLPAAVDYTVTVSRVRYTFAQSSVSINALAADETANFMGSPVTFTIAGRLTSENAPLPGVTMTLAGSATATVTTDDQGAYSFLLPAEGSYSVTPSLAHYTFRPAGITVNNLIEDHSDDFAGTLIRHAIAGRVSNTNNYGISGVQIVLSGFTTATTTTDADGGFSFSDLAEGQDYTIAAKLKYFIFDRPSYSFNDLASNQYAGFIINPARYGLSGRVTRSDGSAVTGATVNLSGPQSATSTTDTSGNYSFSNLLAANNYLVSVSRINYSFSPAAAPVDLDADRKANFAGTFVNYQISGKITNKGIELPGVSLTTGSHIVTTGADGRYSLSLPAEATYTLTPSLANFTFTPATATFSNVSADQSFDFQATIDPGVPILISQSDSTRAIALDAVLRTTEPFDLLYDGSWATDRRTRIIIYAANFDLAPNESATNITAEVQDASGRIYTLPVEYAAKIPTAEWLTRVIVRVSDDLTDVGDVLLRIRVHGLSSNRVRLGIGHVGGGPPDDANSYPTPGTPQ
jgi:hypothetical protein